MIIRRVFCFILRSLQIIYVKLKLMILEVSMRNFAHTRGSRSIYSVFFGWNEHQKYAYQQ